MLENTAYRGATMNTPVNSSKNPGKIEIALALSEGVQVGTEIGEAIMSQIKIGNESCFSNNEKIETDTDISDDDGDGE
jgi:hypothetical protein